MTDTIQITRTCFKCGEPGGIPRRVAGMSLSWYAVDNPERTVNICASCAEGKLHPSALTPERWARVAPRLDIERALYPHGRGLSS